MSKFKVGEKFVVTNVETLEESIHGDYVNGIHGVVIAVYPNKSFYRVNLVSGVDGNGKGYEIDESEMRHLNKLERALS